MLQLCALTRNRISVALCNRHNTQGQHLTQELNAVIEGVAQWLGLRLTDEPSATQVLPRASHSATQKRTGFCCLRLHASQLLLKHLLYGAGVWWGRAGARVHQNQGCRNGLAGTRCGGHRTSPQPACRHTWQGEQTCQQQLRGSTHYSNLVPALQTGAQIVVLYASSEWRHVHSDHQQL